MMLKWLKEYIRKKRQAELAKLNAEARTIESIFKNASEINSYYIDRTIYLNGRVAYLTEKLKDEECL
jgi:hypothetical protein